MISTWEARRPFATASTAAAFSTSTSAFATTTSLAHCFLLDFVIT
ncbi:MAG TPA: hypothetical protein VGL38_09405 [bacterium]